MSDQYYSNKLEGFAVYKSLCDYTIAEPKFIMPSSCLIIDCICGWSICNQRQTVFQRTLALVSAFLPGQCQLDFGVALFIYSCFGSVYVDLVVLADADFSAPTK